MIFGRRDFLHAIFLDKVIIALASIVVDNEVVAENMRVDLEQQDWSVLEGSSDFVTKVAEIQYEDEPIRIIRLAASKASSKQQLFTSIANTTTLALLLILAISITSILVTKRYIIHPLTNMMDAAKISNGEVDAA